MNNEKLGESIRCFVIIAIATAAIAILDSITRAFFYEQAQRMAPYLPLLTGSMALGALGATRRNREKPAAPTSQTNSAGIRRVRVTGPLK